MGVVGDESRVQKGEKGDPKKDMERTKERVPGPLRLSSLPWAKIFLHSPLATAAMSPFFPRGSASKMNWE